MTLTSTRLAPVSVVGVGSVDRRRTKGKTAVELSAEAVAAAVRDAGLRQSDIDGLLAIAPMTEPHFMFSHLLAEHLDLEPQYCLTLQGGGVGPASALRTAAAALAAGYCKYAVVVEGDGRGTRLTGDKLQAMAKTKAWNDEWDDTHGITTVTKFALLARAYMDRSSTTRAHLSQVAVAAREFARQSPWASFQQPLAFDEALNAPPVCEPLHRYDCCPVTDWGGAMVVTTPDRAARLPRAAVQLLGSGEQHHAFHPGMHPGMDSGTLRRCASVAFAEAGMGPADIQAAQIFDAFSVLVPMALEEMGFCPPGEGGEWAVQNALTLGSRLPINTYGGMLNCGNAHVYGLLEAIVQLRGEAGPRQVPGLERCLVQATGGTSSGSAVLIFGR